MFMDTTFISARLTRSGSFMSLQANQPLSEASQGRCYAVPEPDTTCLLKTCITGFSGHRNDYVTNLILTFLNQLTTLCRNF